MATARTKPGAGSGHAICDTCQQRASTTYVTHHPRRLDRFELGGGHWIFGGDPVVTRLSAGVSEIRSCRRRSAVLFLGASEPPRELRDLMVPYSILFCFSHLMVTPPERYFNSENRFAACMSTTRNG